MAETAPAVAPARPPRWRHVRSTQKLFLVQQMEIMVRAGVPLTSTLDTLRRQAGTKYLGYVLGEMLLDVEKGLPLATALARHPQAFSELMVNMVEAGETSGRLDEVLGQLYLQMKKDHEIVSRVRGALTYPAIVVTAMFGIGTFMIVFVVPKLTSLFKEVNVALPLPTRILIAVSDFIANNGALAAGGFLLTIGGIVWTIRQPRGKRLWHTLLLHLPVAGAIVKKVNVARFARTVSAFLKTDIPITKTLETTANVLGNVHYKEALRDAAAKVTKGVTLEEALRPHGHLFNPTVLQMISVGEQSGSLDNMLAEAANFYEGEVNQIMETLPSLLEPILMLMLGFGVGGMAVAIILPLYTLSAAF